ncbi:MAG: energy transducer TonB [Armatimonas sp.]
MRGINRATAMGLMLLLAASGVQAQVLVETPARVWNSFYAARTMTKTDEFEKTRDFLKRVEKAFDMSRVYYFPVKNRNTTKGNANYQYDADTEKLVAIAGHKPDNGVKPDQRGTPIVVDTVTEDQGKYLGKSSDNRQVMVQRTSIREYVVNVLNTSKLPSDVFAAGDNKFSVTAKVAPDDARKITGDLEVVVGVRFVALNRARFELVYGHAPTIAEPYNSETTMACIDGNVVRVLVRHRASGKVLRDITIPGGADDRSLEALNPPPDKPETAPVVNVKKDPATPPTTKPENTSEGDDDHEALTVFWVDPAKDEAVIALAYKGTVEAEVSIAVDGSHTTTLTKKSGRADVDKAILAVLARWTWEPAVVKGKPVASKKKLSFEFKSVGV